jgi:hypothetical protein
MLWKMRGRLSLECKYARVRLAMITQLESEI